MAVAGYFLLFDVCGLKIAVDSGTVKRLIWLPELTVVEECPPNIAGVVNMSGQIVPVMDLGGRFGYHRHGYHLSDRVLILEIIVPERNFPDRPDQKQGVLPTGSQLGIIVDDVIDILEIPAEDMEMPPFQDGKQPPYHHFIKGLAKTEDGVIMILDAHSLIDFYIDISCAATVCLPDTEETPRRYFCPAADEKEKKAFHARAQALRRSAGDEKAEKGNVAALVMLSGERFCIPLDAIREFTLIHNITFLPCCPSHVLGAMNLRGHVLALLDMRIFLNLQTDKEILPSQVIVVEAFSMPVGFVVDEILDIVDLKADDILQISPITDNRGGKFIRGTTFVEDTLAAVVDMNKLLAWEGLTVNEEV